MQYQTDIGSGNSWCPTPRAEIMRLTNEEIDRETAILFLKWQQIPLTLQWSSRKTKNRWGVAFYDDNRIILYRKDVWTFLHETAHIVARGKEGHGKTFGLVLHGLYLKWKEVTN
jgi:hypothetical protein